MPDRQIAAGPGNTSQDIVTRLRGHLAKPDDTTATHWDGCIDTHPLCALAWALDEIERQRAELRDLRNNASEALWDARNIATALAIAIEWHRKSPALHITRDDQRRRAIDNYDLWRQQWRTIEDAITPPGWMR